MLLIITAVVFLGLLGVVIAVGLGYAVKRFAVRQEPRAAQIYELLPHLDCGACGYGSCEALAKAVAEGKAPPGACIPGRIEVARQLAQIIGDKLAERRPVCAFVHCEGGDSNATVDFEYEGPRDCEAAMLIQGGPKACKYACLGFGNCARVCPFGAITMDEEGLPRVNPQVCTGCGLCGRTCPREIIELLPRTVRVYLGCSSLEKGQVVKQKCKVGCIACGICAKVTPKEGITMEGNLPKMHYDRTDEFDAAADRCPMSCFVTLAPKVGVALGVAADEKRRAKDNADT